MKKMNVLFVISSTLTIGGVPTVTMSIVEALKDVCSFDIVVSGFEAGYYDQQFKSYGGKIFNAKTVSYQDSKLGIVCKGRFIYDTVIEACSNKKYDVIHCENGFESGPAVAAAQKCGVPIRIVHAHGTYSTAGKNIVAKIYKMNCKRLIEKYSTLRLACSSKAGESLFNSDFKNILNPLDVDYYQSIKKIPHDGINLLQIGYYCKLKNQLYSLRILEDLLAQGIKVHLFFIGYDNGSGYYQELMDDIKNNKLTDYVTMLVSDYPKNELMGKIDFLLLPSTSEGLPLVVLEAQAGKVHAIVSDVVTKDVDLGNCSFLTIDNPKVWSEKIANFVYNDETLDTSKLQLIRKENYMNTIKDFYGVI